MNSDNSRSELRMRTGLRIRRERILWGMTQEELSDLLGVSANYLGQIERGNRDLSRKIEDRMCQLFHLDRNELHSLEDPEAVRQLKDDNLMMTSLTMDDIHRLLATCSREELQVCGHMLRSMLLYFRHPDSAVMADLPPAYMAAASAPGTLQCGSAGRYLSMLHTAI